MGRSVCGENCRWDRIWCRRQIINTRPSIGEDRFIGRRCRVANGRAAAQIRIEVNAVGIRDGRPPTVTARPVRRSGLTYFRPLRSPLAHFSSLVCPLAHTGPSTSVGHACKVGAIWRPGSAPIAKSVTRTDRSSTVLSGADGSGSKQQRTTTTIRWPYRSATFGR